jgi:probable F420-dependent oxidoreductase
MISHRPFRFAVQAITVNAKETVLVSAADWRELARKTEALGYSTLSVGDHYVDRGRVPQQLAPITSMAFAAAATTTLRVGSRVFCVDYHVPAALAKEAATLDLLSDGRLELGIGAGWSPGEYESMGLTYDAPGQRVSKLEEMVALFKAHFSGEDMDLRGEHINVTGYAGLPHPAQRPHPPIMIGGGKKRVLSLAGREADIASVAHPGFEARNEDGLTAQEETLRRVSFVKEAAGDRFTTIELETAPYFTEITDDPEEPLARVADWWKVGTEGLLDHPSVLIGTVDEVVERLIERRELYGFNYITVLEGMIDAFAPVVARLAGT